ncbi:MAG: hypothetical protein ACK4S4_01700 [Pyrinomonadaceae bacterium]
MSDKPITVKYESLVVIWASLLASQVVFAIVIYAIRPELLSVDLSRPPLGDQPLITLAFIASAIVFFVLSFVLSAQHMRRAVRDRDAGCVQTGLVLGCALGEVPSVLGLILALVWEYQYFFIWILLGALSVLFHFPRKSALEAVREP